MGSHPPTENEAKGAESESDEPSLDRFNSLAKGLFGVDRETLKEAERRFKERGQGAFVGPSNSKK